MFFRFKMFYVEAVEGTYWSLETDICFDYSTTLELPFELMPEQVILASSY